MSKFGKRQIHLQIQGEQPPPQNKWKEIYPKTYCNQTTKHQTKKGS